MIRLLCPHCNVPIVLLGPPEPEEKITCPACGRPFVPTEEEYIEPEDE